MKPIDKITSLPLEQRLFGALSILFLIVSFLVPAVPFIHDGGIYYHMARAMADHGALHIGANGGVEGAPALLKELSHGRDGLVYPQYPSGYIFIASPFYAVLGMRGLILLNAISAIAALWLTFVIAAKLFDQRIALWALGLFTAASFLPTYAWGVWPHMLSLALWLGAFLLAILGDETSKRANSLLLFAAAGLVIGTAINIRVDVILAAPALFFWLRFFARPSDRIAPAMLFLGLAPGLVIAATLNALKFGDFTPFTYGPKTGVDSIGRYLSLMAGGGAVIVLTWAFNLHSIALRFAASVKPRMSLFLISGLAFVSIAILLLLQPARDFLYGLYVLIFNLQAHNAYFQAGVEPNEFGQLVFWGYPKKALIQSLPYLPLIAIPIIAFLRGGNVRAFSLCFLAIGAPVCFYALNQWHGGGSYSLRYFLPAIPFIAILSAWSIGKLISVSRTLSRERTLLSLVVASVMFLAFQAIGRMSEALFVPTALYPQWLIAAALAGAVVLHLRAPHSATIADRALAIGAFAVSYAVIINANEAFAHEKTRAEQAIMANEASAAITGAPLILTGVPLMFIPAERKGASVMAAKDEYMATIVSAVNAFQAAGRCVYFHNSYARDLIAPHLLAEVSRIPIWVSSATFPDDPRMAFFTLTAQKSSCNLG